MNEEELNKLNEILSGHPAFQGSTMPAKSGMPDIQQLPVVQSPQAMEQVSVDPEMDDNTLAKVDALATSVAPARTPAQTAPVAPGSIPAAQEGAGGAPAAEAAKQLPGDKHAIMSQYRALQKAKSPPPVVNPQDTTPMIPGAEIAPPIPPAMPTAPAGAPAAPVAPQANPIDMYKAMLEKAMKDKKEQMFMARLGEGGTEIGAALGGAKPNVEYWRNMQAEAGKPVDDMMSPVLKYSQLLNQTNLERDKNDPKSSISKAYRDLAGKMGYVVDENTSATQLKELEPLIAKREAMKETIAARKESAAARADAVKNRASDKLDERTTKRFDELGKRLMSEMSSSRSAFGKAANTVRSAEAIEQLTTGIDPNDLIGSQITEIARNLDAMLSSGQATIAGMKKLIPETAIGDLRKTEQYIMGIPKGARQGQFVKLMMDTVKREKDLAKDQIQRTQKKVLGSYSDLEKADPEKYDEMMKLHGIRPVDGASEETPGKSAHAPGTIVQVKGKKYKVGADGDSLEPVGQ